MAPLSWTFIYTFMTLMFIACSLKLYFLTPTPSTVSKTDKSMNTLDYMSWKW